MSDSSERRTTFSVSKALSGMSPKKSGFRATDLETGMSMEVIEVEARRSKAERRTYDDDDESSEANILPGLVGRVSPVKMFVQGEKCPPEPSGKRATKMRSARNRQTMRVFCPREPFMMVWRCLMQAWIIHERG